MCVARNQANSDFEWPRRQPVLFVLTAGAVGIVIDRYLDWHWPVYLTVAVFGLVYWALFARNAIRSWPIAGLILSTAGIGGLWHHIWWNYYPANDIGSYARELAEPQRIRAIVEREPRWMAVMPADAFDATPSGIRSSCSLRCEAIQAGDQWVPVSGRANLFVEGQMSGFRVGDQIEVVALLSQQRPPRNPGQFDFANFCRGERLSCVLYALQLDSIRFDSRATRWSLSGIFSDVRQRFDQLLWQHLSSDNAALASGLLLGMREQLDEAERANYLMTGTVHLLAISGLHVGILAGGILGLGTCGLLGRRTSLVATVGFTIFYAGLVGLQAPVVRAAVLVVVWCISKWSGRSGFSFNSLAVAACVVLLINPSQLFQVGAQLSFLAVATLSATYRYFQTVERDPLDQWLYHKRPWMQKLAGRCAATMGRTIAVTTLIWLLAVPLVAMRFHIVAPIALVANPLLIVPLTAALLSGFAFLLVGWWMPQPLAAPLQGIFEASLISIQGIVEWSSQIPGAYWWTIGPSLYFVLGFAVLSLILFGQTRFPVAPRWAVSLSVLAMSVGWLLPSAIEIERYARRSDMEVVFADLGHGGCALVKLPGGQNLLFDAGSSAPPGYAARTIAATLWSERVYHLDAMIISHADLDHYNAVDRLTDYFSVGRVYVPETMRVQVNSPAAILLQRLESKQIPVSVIEAGDVLKTGNSVQLAILHPPSKQEFSNDNAGSAVCELMYRGDRVLLTADVEREGLDLLLDQTARRCLLAMAPHHGSLSSHPSRFMPWCAPRNVVICDEWKDNREQDLTGFAAAEQVFLTGRDGAVRLRWADRNSPAEIQAFARNPWR